MYVPLLGTQQPEQSLDVPHITAKLAAQFMREFPWEQLRLLKRGTTCHDVAVECPAPKWWPAKRDR